MISFVAVLIPAYRVFQLAENMAEAEKPEALLQEIRDFLGDACEVTPRCI